MERNAAQRTKQLDDWLAKVGARSLWAVSDQSRLVEAWTINGRIAIVVRYKIGHGGWDIYTAPSSLKIDETLGLVECLLGLR